MTKKRARRRWGAPALGEAPLWNAVIERSPIALAVTEDDDYVVRLVNDEFCRLARIEKDSTIGRSLPDALPLALGQTLRTALDRVHSTGQSERFTAMNSLPSAAGSRSLDIATWLVRAGPPGVLAVHFVDVTDNLEAARAQTLLAEKIRTINEQLIVSGIREQELAEEHAEQLNALLRSYDGGVAIVDQDVRLTMMNDLGREILGLAKMGQPLEPAEYRHIDLRQLDHSIVSFEEWPFARAVRGQRFTNEEFILMDSGPAQIRLSFGGSAIHERPAGKVTPALVVFQDVTELRKLEELREDYISLISHDLREPLTAIMGYAQLLEMHLLKAGQNVPAERAVRIRAAADHMNAMIHELMESSRLEAGSIVLERELTNLIIDERTRAPDWQSRGAAQDPDRSARAHAEPLARPRPYRARAHEPGVQCAQELAG